jgi:hypothetical protein
MKPKTYPAQSYCGCCGREIASGLFCAGCGEHLLSSRLPAEERTYFAQHGKPCPLDVAGLRREDMFADVVKGAMERGIDVASIIAKATKKGARG